MELKSAVILSHGVMSGGSFELAVNRSHLVLNLVKGDARSQFLGSGIGYRYDFYELQVVLPSAKHALAASTKEVGVHVQTLSNDQRNSLKQRRTATTQDLEENKTRQRFLSGELSNSIGTEDMCPGL